MKQALRLANAFRTQQESARLTGTSPLLDRKTTVSEYAEQWADTRLHKRSTARRVRVHLKHVTGSKLGSRPLYAVKPSEVQAWVADRSRYLSPGTMRNLYVTLKAVFRMAVDDGVIGRSPCHSIRMPRLPQEKVVPLTVAQVQALVQAMPPRYRALVEVQAGLGLRVGELLALQVRDLPPLMRGDVRIDRQQSDAGANEFELPKYDKTRRVPLPVATAEVIARHLATEPQADREGLIFRSRFGNGLRQDYYTQRILRPAVARAGLPAGTTSHDLRHHYAGVLLAAGVSTTELAKHLGDTVAVVERTYANPLPNNGDRARHAIDAAWSHRPLGDSAQGASTLGQVEEG